MATKQSPLASSRYASGTGVWTSFIDEFISGLDEPTMLGRFTLFDPLAPTTRVIGMPLYQAVLVENLHPDALTTGPLAWMLLHTHLTKRIVRVPIANPDSPFTFDTFESFVSDYASVGALSSPGSAFAGVPFIDPADFTEGVTTIISVPAALDKLGVTVLYKDTTGHTVSAVSGITGTDLGFAGVQLTSWRWVGFVVRRDTATPDTLHVLGSIEKLDVTRKGPGDLSSSTMYAFSVQESTQTLIGPATQVTVDIPFTPHQVVEGQPSSVSGESPLTLWCIGRVDSEFINPSVTHRPATVEAASAAMTTVGGLGIWASLDPTMKTWVRIWEAPMGISCPAIHHLNGAGFDTPHLEVSRDAGIVFHPSSQRLLPFTIDTDPGQDPWVEEALYAR